MSVCHLIWSAEKGNRIHSSHNVICSVKNVHDYLRLSNHIHSSHNIIYSVKNVYNYLTAKSKNYLLRLYYNFIR